nr:venom protein [Lampona murina]
MKITILHDQREANAPSVQRIKISRIVVHKDYDNLYENDIALLKTAKPIDIAGSEGYVNGICLPESNEDPTGNATLIGWGFTDWEGSHSDILKEAEIPLIDIDTCNKHYPNRKNRNSLHINENMICAGTKNAHACLGDTGGPLLQIKGDVTTLIGVLATGEYCDIRPGVYTKVSAYLDWIKTIMSK